MARTRKASKPASKKAAKQKTRVSPIKWLRRWLFRLVFYPTVLVLLLIVLYRFVAPPTTIYIWQESSRLGGVDRIWTDADDIAPVMFRSVVAAEDANFCNHWGFDMNAIRDAIEDGGARGASTISQQVVKNTFLWHGRTYVRKALEALITPVMEAVWPKRRILEVYLNVAEFDKGVFGVQAAARRYFNTSAKDLTPTQAARLAAILPNPKDRSAASPSSFTRKRAASILDGAETIRRDGRAACFE